MPVFAVFRGFSAALGSAEKSTLSWIAHSQVSSRIRSFPTRVTELLQENSVYEIADNCVNAYVLGLAALVLAFLYELAARR